MYIFGYILVGLTMVLNIAINAICFVLLIRIILGLFMSPVNFHPIVGYLRDISEPVVGPFRKYFPEMRVRFDVVAAVVLVVLFFATRFVSAGLYSIGASLGAVLYEKHPFVSFLYAILTIYYWIIIIRIVIPWVYPDPNNSFVRFLNQITEPFLRFFRRYLPIWRYGFDFTPFVAILALFFIREAGLNIINRLILGF